MPATKISLDEAKPDKLFYFVANVVVYRAADGRCLILKRDEREKVHPGRWGVPGGKLEWAELDLAYPTRMNGDVIDFEHAVEKLLAREAYEEAAITIKSELKYIGSVAFVRPDGIPVMLVKFAAEYGGGEVVPEEGGFTDFAWVNDSEVKNYEVIDGIAEEVAATIAAFEE